MAEEVGFYPKSLCIDLETSVETEAATYKIAAWRADTKQSEVFKGKFRSAEVKPKLDALTVGASFLLGHLCQGVKDRIGREAIIEDLLSLLRAMSQPFGNTQAERPSFELKKVTRDHYRVRLRRSWQQIREISEKRHAIAQVLLNLFLGKLPPEVRGADLLVESKAGDQDVHPSRNPALDVRFVELGNADVYMDFAGQSSDPKLHQAISELRVGDELKLVGRELQNNRGIVVGRLSKSCAISDQNVASVKVNAIASRFDKQVLDPVWRERLKVKAWETVLCSIQTS